MARRTKAVSGVKSAATITAALAAWMLVAAPVKGPVSTVGTPIDLRKYEMTFDEPFDSLDVSPWGPKSKWIAHTPWAGDFGDAQFIDPKPGEPFTTSGGFLSITMTRKNGKWQSGLLSSADHYSNGFTQAGGYFEMRAKLPGGPGVWPAFWLDANVPKGTSGPEIDVIEYYGQFPDSYRASTHVWRDGKSIGGDSIKIDVPARSLETGYHLYGVSIDPKDTIFYLDRKEVTRLPTKPEFLLPVYMLVDLGAGGGWPIEGMPDPSVMSVDYVRAYKLRR
jgi:beta-glucanase (GH16 family)